MGSEWEPFQAGEAPFLLQRFAKGDQVALELRQAGVVRRFFLHQGQVVGFASTHPREQATPGATQKLTLLASIVAELTSTDGGYRQVSFSQAPGEESHVLLNLVLLEALRRVADPAPVLALLGQELLVTRATTAPPSDKILAPMERFLWEQVGEGKDLKQLQELLPREPQSVLRAVAGLVCAGFLAASPKPASPERPKPQLPPANPALRARLARIAQEGDLPPTEVERELTPEELAQAQRDKEEGLALLVQGGDERRALRLLTKAVALLPDPLTLVRLAEVEVANPLWRQRALAHLKQALEIDPKCTPAWLALANYWGIRGDTGKQRRCLESILKYEPQNAAVRQALADLR